MLYTTTVNGNSVSFEFIEEKKDVYSVSFQVNNDYIHKNLDKKTSIAITRWLLKTWKEFIHKNTYVYIVCSPLQTTVEENIPEDYRKNIYKRLGFKESEGTAQLHFGDSEEYAQDVYYENNLDREEESESEEDIWFRMSEEERILAVGREHIWLYDEDDCEMQEVHTDELSYGFERAISLEVSDEHKLYLIEQRCLETNVEYDFSGSVDICFFVSRVNYDWIEQGFQKAEDIPGIEDISTSTRRRRR
jgi:hypothetical protein